MSKVRNVWPLIVLILIACGPETIFVRPYLDTPEQHVRNGHMLLKQDKWDDACREFERARELDPQYAEAYIGLGVAYARGGDVEKGLRMLHKAEKMAKTDDERAAVRDAFLQLQQR
jgi:Flp pilus assembly protein TadD